MGAAGKPRKLGRGLAGLIDDPVRIDRPRADGPTREQGPAAPSATEPTPVSAPANSPASTPAGTPASTPASTAPEADRPRAAGLAEVPIASIEPNRFQPRKHFDEEQLAALAASITAQGLLQPVVVRPAQGGAPGAVRYELIAGERRWRAAQRAGLASIPAIIREATDQAAAELALVENVQREDLNPIDRARALRMLLERFGLTQAAVGERVGLDRSSVANLIRLTELEPAIQEQVALGVLSQGHAKALLAAPAGDGRLRLAERAAQEQWSVRATEQAVRDAAAGRPPHAQASAPEKSPDKSPELLDLERRLGEHLGTRVLVQLKAGGKAGDSDRTRTSGQLVIQFYDLDHFDGLMDKMGYSAG